MKRFLEGALLHQSLEYLANISKPFALGSRAGKAILVLLQYKTNLIVALILLTQRIMVRMKDGGFRAIRDLVSCLEKPCRNEHILVGEDGMIEPANRQICVPAVSRASI